jgi:hypothetical protein
VAGRLERIDVFGVLLVILLVGAIVRAFHGGETNEEHVGMRARGPACSPHFVCVLLRLILGSFDSENSSIDFIQYIREPQVEVTNMIFKKNKKKHVSPALLLVRTIRNVVTLDR